MNKEYNSTQTRNTIPSLSLECHSDFTVTERTHSVGVRGGWRDGIKLPADGGQCDWHSWHLGTAAQAAALSAAKDVSTEGGTGERERSSHFSFFLLSALPVLKAIKEQISSQREGR